MKKQTGYGLTRETHQTEWQSYMEKLKDENIVRTELTVFIYAALILYGLSLWEWPAHSPDLGWHLHGGAWILANGKVPGTDFINSLNSHWHDYHWLGQIIFYQIYKIGGYEALQIFVGLCLGLLFKTLIDIIYLSDSEERLPHVIKLLLGLFGARCIAQIVAVRPQVILLLVLGYVVKILVSQNSKYDFLKVLFLSIVAANVHVYWIFIPFIWLTLTLPSNFNEPIQNSSLIRCLAGSFVLACTGLISPYGIIPFMNSGEHPWYINYSLLFDYLLMPASLQSSIGEMKSSLSAKGLLPYLLLLFVAVIGKIFSLKQIRSKLGPFILTISGFVLSLRSLKFSAVFGIFALPWLTSSLAKAYPKDSNIYTKDKTLTWITASICILFFGLMALWHFPYTNSKYDHIRSMLPIDACKAIAQQKVSTDRRDHIRILTHFNHGGWCRWILHQEDPNTDYRVTTDGRTQWVDPKQIKDSFDLYALKGNWRNTLSSWNPDVALVWKQSQLAQLMSMDPVHWQLVFQDRSFAVFLPINAGRK